MKHVFVQLVTLLESLVDNFLLIAPHIISRQADNSLPWATTQFIFTCECVCVCVFVCHSINIYLYMYFVIETGVNQIIERLKSEYWTTSSVRINCMTIEFDRQATNHSLKMMIHDDNQVKSIILFLHQYFFSFPVIFFVQFTVHQWTWTVCSHGM